MSTLTQYLELVSDVSLWFLVRVLYLKIDRKCIKKCNGVVSLLLWGLR